MGSLVIPIILGIPVAAFVGALVWTSPGPQQQRHRTILTWLAAALLALAVVLLVGGGVLEHVYETPESQESQWGTGWAFLAMILTFPMVPLAVALFTVAYTTARPMGTRVGMSMAAAVLIGGPLWVGLVWMTLVQVEERS